MSKYKKGTFVVVPNIQGLFALKDAYAIAVYVCINKFVNDNDDCWPSIGTLAKLCGCSRSTVKRRLEMLEQAGLLTKTIQKREDNNQNYSNLYKIFYKKDRKKKDSNEAETEGGRFPQNLGEFPENLGGSPENHELNSINSIQRTQSNILRISEQNSQKDIEIDNLRIKKNTLNRRIRDIIYRFQDFNSGCQLNKPEKEAVRRLIDRFGPTTEERVAEVVHHMKTCSGIKVTIRTPWQMDKKYDEYRAWKETQKYFKKKRVGVCVI